MIKVWVWKCDALHEVGISKAEERVFEGGVTKDKRVKEVKLEKRVMEVKAQM
jgi:hypothetical protein